MLSLQSCKKTAMENFIDQQYYKNNFTTCCCTFKRTQQTLLTIRIYSISYCINKSSPVYISNDVADASLALSTNSAIAPNIKLCVVLKYSKFHE